MESKSFDYTTEIKLKHNEIPAKVNSDTGEVVVVNSRPNNIPEGKEVFEPNGLFRKDYNNSWKFLRKNLTHLEVSATIGLCLMAKANTGSLEPIDDNTGVRDLGELLGISVNKVKSVLSSLWELGVYGKFEVHDANKPYTKYWLVNPYLSFTGKLISSDIANLFSGTHIAHAFRDENYVYKRLRAPKSKKLITRR